MGLDDRDVVPGLMVRHRDGWTGRLLRQGTPGIAEVEPDGGSGPRWFDLADFDPVTWDGGALPARSPMVDALAMKPAAWSNATVPRTTDLERRYLTDPAFHMLVTYQGQLLKMASYQDVQDAAVLAIRIDRERQQKERRAAAADVRGRNQNDAQEERGTYEAAKPEPSRA